MWKQGVYWAYVLENAVGRFYVGSTQDVERRLEEHNATEKVGAKYTHKHAPWRLVWSEEHPSRSSAMKREEAIKKMKSAQWIRRELLNG